MSGYRPYGQDPGYTANVITEEQVREETNSFMMRVYNWMGVGLFLTGVIAMYVASSEELIEKLAGSDGLLMVMIFGQIGLVMALSWGINRISAALAIIMFLAYAALNGVIFSFIFLAYTSSSIASTFFITAGTFGITSVFGYVTKRDLTGVGQFMFMGLIGIILASLVNLFFHNPMIYWVTTYLGVFIFVGLTAYDTQKIKTLAFAQLEGGEAASKAAIIGALTLYLDFINLFLFLLRIFGRRR